MLRLPLAGIIAAISFAGILGLITGDLDEPAFLIAVGMFVVGIGFGAGLAVCGMRSREEVH